MAAKKGSTKNKPRRGVNAPRGPNAYDTMWPQTQNRISTIDNRYDGPNQKRRTTKPKSTKRGK